MTETGFGPGADARTGASTPSAPVIETVSSTSVRAAIGGDANPAHTEYAILNVTEGRWVAGDGGGSETPVWLTKDGWGITTVTGLAPSTGYLFRARARNRDGVETDTGPSASVITHGAGTTLLGLALTVAKASSTITAPTFMSGLGAGIIVAGKSLTDFGFHADTTGGLDMPPFASDADGELVPGEHAWRMQGGFFATKYIVLEGHVHGETPASLRLRLAYLKSFLATFEGNPWRPAAPVTLERADLPDRHWHAFYESLETEELRAAPGMSSSARVRIAMRCPSPFARSNEVVRNVFGAEAGTFRTLDLGNAPSEAVYVLTGPSENPSFAVGDMAFHCDFADGLAYTDAGNVTRAGTFSPPEHEAGAWRTTETGAGILVTDTYSVSYTATGNGADGAWVVVLAPRWQSSSRTGDAVMLEHRGDADNLIQIRWDGASQAWVFRRRADGVESAASTGFQAFTAGTRIVLGITYDVTNAGGMKIFVDGRQEGMSGDMRALDTHPSALTLGGADSLTPDAVYDMVAGWSRMLSADEMTRIASDPEAVVNRNAMVAYDGVLEAGDILAIDSAKKTATLFDVSEGTRTNALDAVTGFIPSLAPGRRRAATDRTQTVVHVLNGAEVMEVRYRRMYL